jgi:dihydroflavonol-4-reductase
MTNPAARGERFLPTAGESLWMVDIAKVLRRRMGAVASQVPTRELPNWLVRLAALRDPKMRGIVPLLGVNLNATSEKARRLLGWAPRSSEEAIVATAESLIRLGPLRKDAA